MHNSILKTSNNNNNQNLLSQLIAFKNQFSGDPKQKVMEMVNNGSITKEQLNQAMQMASQIQGFLK